jgi:hypothetical protein
MTILPVRRPFRSAPLLALAALFALLAPTAGLFVNPQLAGWEPNHGHAGSAAAIAHHTHPYDHHVARSANAEGPSDQTASDVTFTPSDDASATAAILLAREPAPLPAPAALVAAPRSTSAGSLEGLVLGVPTPPPRA